MGKSDTPVAALARKLADRIEHVPTLMREVMDAAPELYPRLLFKIQEEIDNAKIDLLPVSDFIERNWTPQHVDKLVRRVMSFADGGDAFITAAKVLQDKQKWTEPAREESARFWVFSKLTADNIRRWADDIAAFEKKSGPGRTQSGSSGRRRPPRRPRDTMTAKQKEAWLLSERGLSYREVGEQLKISATAAGKRIKAAQQVVDRVSKSRAASQTLPTDARGQSTVSS